MPRNDVYVLTVDTGDEEKDLQGVHGGFRGVGGRCQVALYGSYFMAMECAIRVVEADLGSYGEGGDELAIDLADPIARMRDTLNNPDDRVAACNEIWQGVTQELGTIEITEVPFF